MPLIFVHIASTACFYSTRCKSISCEFKHTIAQDFTKERSVYMI